MNVKKLIAKTARTWALMIMPLAVAVSARATTILPTAAFACNVTGGNDCGEGNFAQLPAQNGVEGVKFFTNGPLDIFNDGQPAEGGFNLSFETNGSLDGDLASGFQMPVFYNFTLSGSAAGGDFSGTTWTVMMFFFTVADQTGGSFTASGSGTGTFSGSGTIVSPFVPSGMNMSVIANINVNPGPSVTDLTVSVPASSMDFNVVSTPEPATGGLFGAALVALGWAFHRRKK